MNVACKARSPRPAETGARGATDNTQADADSALEMQMIRSMGASQVARGDDHHNTSTKRLPPGLTAKNYLRHYVQHNYHDHSHDSPENEEEMQIQSALHVDGAGGSASTSPVVYIDQDILSCAKTGPRGGVTIPFPLRLHELLDTIENDGYADVISWQPHGRSFCIHKNKEFVDTVMPRYFRQSKWTSFQRQLNLYGFTRITRGQDKGGYYHELFLRGKLFLANRIVRNKIKGTRIKAVTSPESEPDFYLMPHVGYETKDMGAKAAYSQQGHQQPMCQLSMPAIQQEQARSLSAPLFGSQPDFCPPVQPTSYQQPSDQTPSMSYQLPQDFLMNPVWGGSSDAVTCTSASFPDPDLSQQQQLQLQQPQQQQQQRHQSAPHHYDMPAVHPTLYRSSSHPTSNYSVESNQHPQNQYQNQYQHQHQPQHVDTIWPFDEMSLKPRALSPGPFVYPAISTSMQDNYFGRMEDTPDKLDGRVEVVCDSKQPKSLSLEEFLSFPEDHGLPFDLESVPMESDEELGRLLDLLVE
jgi:hypothetical protein